MPRARPVPRRRLRAGPAAVLIAAAIVLQLPSGSLAADVPYPVDAAVLTGVFRLTGQITAAHGVKGERVGQPVTRLWTFAANCPSGPCPTIPLTRQRGPSAFDQLTLTLTRPARWSGTGSFYAPVRCHGRVYPQGELIPFTVTATVTATQQSPTGVIYASQVSATYSSQKRVNLTRCVPAFGHDAARYTGTLIAPAPPNPVGVTPSG